LADRLGLRYTVLSKAGTGLLHNAAELFGNTLKTIVLTRRLKIDLWLTKYGPGNIAARLRGKRSISFNDDDIDYVPLIAWTSYPFADQIMAPRGVRMGRFAPKALFYPGYHELFYLHPNRFSPDPGVYSELGLDEAAPYGLIRLVALQAHHDVGASGMTQRWVRRLIDRLEGKAKLFITSEKPLPAELQPYRCPLPPDRIHHALAFAEFLVGDSQTMSLEAALLGTPAFRLNSFVGRISVLEQMERYGLSFGFRPGQEQTLLDEIERLMNRRDRRVEFRQRRVSLLADKCDPLPLFVNAVRLMLELQPCPKWQDWALSTE